MSQNIAVTMRRSPSVRSVRPLGQRRPTAAAEAVGRLACSPHRRHRARPSTGHRGRNLQSTPAGQVVASTEPHYSPRRACSLDQRPNGKLAGHRPEGSRGHGDAQPLGQVRGGAPVECRPYEEHGGAPGGRRGQRRADSWSSCRSRSTRPSSTRTSTPRSARSPARSASPASGPARRPAASSRPASASLRPASRPCATPSRSYLAQAVREHDVDIIATPEVDITAGEEDGPGRLRRHRRGAAHDHRARLRRPAGRAADHRRSPTRRSTSPIDAELRRHGELVDVERPAARGDYVTLDLAATRDGEPVARPQRRGLALRARPGLGRRGLRRPAGRRHGRRRAATFTATPTGTEEPADFAVAVKKVQELVLPELTDEWVAENLGEFDTVEDVARRASASALDDGAARPGPPDAASERATDGAGRAGRRGAARAAGQRRAAQPGRELVHAAPGPGHRHRAVPGGHRPGPGRVHGGPAGRRRPRPSRSTSPCGPSPRPRSIEVDRRRPRRRVRAHRRAGRARSPTRSARPTSATTPCPSCAAELRKRKALEWLLEHVEIVDARAAPIDRGSLLLADDGTTHAATTTTRPRRTITTTTTTDHDQPTHDHDHRRREDAPSDLDRSSNYLVPDGGRADQPGRAGLRPLLAGCSRRTSSSWARRSTTRSPT